MKTNSLNGIYGEKAEKIVIDILNEENNLCSSLIQTNFEMRGYFITNPEPRRTLKKMKEDNKIIRMRDNYKLNPTLLGVAN